MFIAGYAAINELFESQEAVHMLARMVSVTILAPAFGPILGGAFLLFMNWHWIFVLLAIWSAITLVLLYFNMPETVPIEQRQKKINIPDIARQYWAVISNFQFMNSALTTWIPVIGMIAWMIAGPFIVTTVFHYTTLDYGIIQVFIFGGLIVGTNVVKRISTEENNNILINAGLGLSLSGAIGAVIVSYYFPNALFTIVAAIMIVTFGNGLSIPILNRLTLEESDAPMGVRVTIVSVVRIIGGVIGSLALAIFYDHTLLSIAAIILFFVACSVVLRLFHKNAART